MIALGVIALALCGACRSEADSHGPGRDAGPRDTGVDAPAEIDAGPNLLTPESC